MPEEIVAELYGVPDFRRAYDPDGLTVEEFDALRRRRCARSGRFIGSYQELVATIRDFMLPNPDVA